MRSLKSLMVLLCGFSLLGLLGLVAPGCSSLDGRNQVVVDIAVTQGVARFVDAGASPAEKAQRREDLTSALSVARQFIKTEDFSTSANWTEDFVRLMDWDSLSVPDQVLISQLLTLLRDEIDLRTANNDGVKVYLARVIDLAIATAGRS